MNLYVIGPVTGKENDNREEFERVREKLWGNPRNRYIGIPHDIVTSTDWQHAMMESIGEMCECWYAPSDAGLNFEKPKYDAIAMLDGWEDSRGARIEHDLAMSLGIECRPWREFL